MMESSNTKKYYILKSSKKFGPFTYEDIIKMLQSKTLFDFDYAWAQGMKHWSTIADTEEFSPEKLKALYASQSSSQSPFKVRQHPRFDIQLSIIAHNNKIFWVGKTLSLSQSGALLAMKNPSLLPGQNIQINFRNPTDQHQSFNVVAEVVGKKMVRHRIQHDSEIIYAVHFTRKDVSCDQQIQRWYEEHLKNKKNSQQGVNCL